MEWFFYNLIILIKLFKIRYLNLDKTLLFPRKQAICLKNLKLCRAPTATKINIFLLRFCTRFLLNNVFKRVSLFINKNIKNECLETRSFLFLQITQDLNKIKKIPNTLLQTLVSRKRVKNIEACQTFQFFRQKTWFLKSNRACFKFLYEISHYLISIIKSKQNQSIRPSLSVQLYQNGTTLQNTFQKLHSKHHNLCGVYLYI